MKIVDRVAAWLILLLGGIHSAFTLKAYPAFTLSAMWFLGTGLLLILVGAVNLLRIRSVGVRGLGAVCLATNVVMLAFTGAIASRLSLKENPQAAITVVLLLVEMICSIAGLEGAQSRDDKVTAAR